MRAALTAFALAFATAFALPATAQDKLNVVATFSILGDFARQVGGDRIELTTLVGPDGDAHVYQAKPADAAAVTKADVVVVNGLNFEGFMTRLVEASGTKAPIIEASDGVETIEGGEDHEGEEARAGADAHRHETGPAGDEHGDTDPHAFQSVPNARVYVRNIAEAFCAADAADCETYKANAAAYDKTLAGLDQEIRSTVAAIPEARRTIITSHDAFGYFGHEYGLKLLAPVGVSTEAEASAADIASLVRQVREEKASAIFLENVANPKLMEQVAAETGVSIGGSLYSDALSAESGAATDYVSMMRYNIKTIAKAAAG